jgi:uroporphyrinogen decarboxylase
MTNKRELVLKAFKGEEVDRVPVGFWYHFASENEFFKGFNQPEIFSKNVVKYNY